MNHPISISLCMITKNEEHCLARCLDSAEKLVDEIIVVDTGSQDHTMEISAEHGASIFSFSWGDDFAAARNYGISKAHGHWILVLDADELLSPISRAELLAFIDASPAEGYYFRICSYLDDGKKTTEDYVVRLFKNLPEYRFVGAIHEQIAGSIQSHTLNNPLIFAPFTIEHYGYLQAEVESKHKFQRNTDLISKALLETPHDPFLHYCLAIEYLQNKNFKQADPLLQKALTLLRGDEGYLPQVLIGRLLIKLSEPDDPHAEELFCKVTQTLPNNGDIFCLYGVWLMQHQRFSEAIHMLKMAMCKNGELVGRSRLSSLLGDAYSIADMNMLAIEHYINALCSAPMDLYSLMRILTLWPHESNPSFGESIWEKLTPDITNAVLQQTRATNQIDLSFATIVLAIMERTKANDLVSITINCSAYVKLLATATPVDSLHTHMYTILTLGAQELLLQSQLLQFSCHPLHNIQQALLDSAERNLLLISSLVQKFFPTDLCKNWEEVFIGETRFGCQPR